MNYNEIFQDVIATLISGGIAFIMPLRCRIEPGEPPDVPHRRTPLDVDVGQQSGTKHRTYARDREEPWTHRVGVGIRGQGSPLSVRARFWLPNWILDF